MTPEPPEVCDPLRTAWAGQDGLGESRASRPRSPCETPTDEEAQNAHRAPRGDDRPPAALARGRTRPDGPGRRAGAGRDGPQVDRASGQRRDVPGWAEPDARPAVAAVQREELRAARELRDRLAPR